METNEEFAVKLPVENFSNTRLEATDLRGGRYAVRPIGQLGTCGWYPFAWTVRYVNARSAADAIRKAKVQP